MITTPQLHWAAGFLEGEGCFTFSRAPRKVGAYENYSMAISAAQVQREPLDRLVSYFGGSLRTYRHKNRPQDQPYWYWHVGSAKAASIMMTLYALMSPKRREAIKNALRVWRTRKHYVGLRTHCPQGHEYTVHNTELDKRIYKRGPGFARVCKTCKRTKARERRARLQGRLL